MSRFLRKGTQGSATFDRRGRRGREATYFPMCPAKLGKLHFRRGLNPVLHASRLCEIEEKSLSGDHGTGSFGSALEEARRAARHQIELM